MLIECPECKKSVSDKAPACPNCGAEIAALGPFAKKGKPIAPAQPARKWARAFAVLFWVGVIYIFARDRADSPQPGQIMVVIGMIGHLAAKIRLWFYTDHWR